MRTYHLVYLDERGVAADGIPSNGVSLLSEVRLEGWDGDSSEWLRPLEFRYTAFDPRRVRYRPLGRGGVRSNLPPRSLASGELELVDLFGNGLPDIVELNGTPRYWRNRGGGRFDLPRTMREAPPGAHLADVGVQLADADGDGRPDLLLTAGARSGYFSLGTNGGWDRRSFVAYARAPSMSLEDSETRLVDLDGDGVVDALRTGASFELFYNDARDGWQRVETHARGNAAAFPDVSFSDQSVRLADMTGDGLQDVVQIGNGRIIYWPYLGHGRWGFRVSMRNSPRFADAPIYAPRGYDPRRVLLGDVDGDGVSDLVYVGSGHTTVWINRGGNGWSEPIVIRGTPTMSDEDAVRLADLDGSGTAGILWSYDAGTERESTYKFLDLPDGTKPYLLSEIDNHMGAVTRIEYAPSTRFYVEDERQPETRWQTTLPFPVQVVRRVEVLDEISLGKLTSEFRYHDGYWDGIDREFRGFGMVEQVDTEIFDRYNARGLHSDRAFVAVGVAEPQKFSPPTLTRTWFHQGPIARAGGAWERPDYRAQYWGGDAEVIGSPDGVAEEPPDLSREARRELVRALRGRILRSETYMLDGGARAGRPLSVTEYAYGVRQEPVVPESPGRRVFFAFLAVQRVTRWERGEDPMTRFEVSAEHDAYGQPGMQIVVGVPRSHDQRARLTEPAAEPDLAIVTATDRAVRDDADHYLVDRVARTTVMEIANDGSQSLDDLIAAIRARTANATVVAQTVNFYDGEAFTGLPFGLLGDFGVLVRTERLVATDPVLAAAYPLHDAFAEAADAPLWSRSAVDAWPSDYPCGCRKPGSECGYRSAAALVRRAR